MSERAPKPKLWSDFDGTAVEIVPKTNPRNWSKYPLAGIEGYADFLHGIQAERIEIAGIVSRRPNIAPRRYVTMRSIAKLGLSEFFSDPEQVLLLGSEESKGEFIAEESCNGLVAIIDDKPHRVGAALLHSFLAQRYRVHERQVVLGVTEHKRSQEYIERFLESSLASVGEVSLQDVAGGVSLRGLHGFRFALDVVQLQPYSIEAGQAFATILVSSMK